MTSIIAHDAKTLAMQVNQKGWEVLARVVELTRGGGHEFMLAAYPLLCRKLWFATISANGARYAAQAIMQASVLSPAVAGLVPN